MINYIIIGIVLVLIGVIVYKGIMARKNGKACSGCSGCSASSVCSANRQDVNKTI